MLNEAVIGVGSNIDPSFHIPKAKSKLQETQILIKESQFYQTKPLGLTNQPDFVNGAYLIHTADSQEDLNCKLKQIEIELGRVKTENKNGPRCIDLDIIVFNREIVDPDFYQRDFLQTTVLELIPDLVS
ncbi:2-amino-4-hydroxy-6-hydroxymethyldihydropteridine diphosphokinase [Roseofilum capinflatum]|uniref:2-amino-4-hydroxy-6-hydroxymethyldihydropteridine diphosphokinase n=1 Tax=Roseofilum capinflatum BLCC-M114 TaxID=3022440 RepID=A0ABT7B9Z9_9CYAN|nr:2-amino-4-hydroxy-6-hydroxymethyldihydropteridine diphosphokinase [Roseofilum capinflatum]MDJ1175429.1 2-amino-4-hydroxy-6-hydroxymethyldihydropteridine diphosphokinase [Roseofilum capinflatum BLCC-M114]